MMDLAVLEAAAKLATAIYYLAAAAAALAVALLALVLVEIRLAKESECGSKSE